MKPIAEKPSETEIKPIDGLDVLKNIPKTGVGKTDLDVISKMRLGGLSNDITFANLPCTFDHKNLGIGIFIVIIERFFNFATKEHSANSYFSNSLIARFSYFSITLEVIFGYFSKILNPRFAAAT